MADDSEKPGDAPASSKAASESKSELPNVDSPPLSPAEEAKPEPEILPALPAPQNRAASGPRLNARHGRVVLLAASIAIAAALGAVAGALAVGGFAAPKPNEAALAERQAMQNSIDTLSAELATLKQKIATADAAARSAIPKSTARIERAPEPETTGSIPPQPAIVAPPLPTPRPVIAAKPPVVRDWSIRYVRDGYVYVHGRGETYEVVLGAPLPGLGPVREIKRQDGRWYVVTPKGLIVSARDRRHFE